MPNETSQLSEPKDSDVVIKDFVMPRMFLVAKEWCDQNPKWQRICDIENSDAMMLSWQEIPAMDRSRWERCYGDDAEQAWREFRDVTWYHNRFGFVAETGVFYASILNVPYPTNSVMVFETGGPRGMFSRGGRSERPRRIPNSSSA